MENYIKKCKNTLTKCNDSLKYLFSQENHNINSVIDQLQSYKKQLELINIELPSCNKDSKYYVLISTDILNTKFKSDFIRSILKLKYYLGTYDKINNRLNIMYFKDPILDKKDYSIEFNHNSYSDIRSLYNKQIKEIKTKKSRIERFYSYAKYLYLNDESINHIKKLNEYPGYLYFTIDEFKKRIYVQNNFYKVNDHENIEDKIKFIYKLIIECEIISDDIHKNNELNIIKNINYYLNNTNQLIDKISYNIGKNNVLLNGDNIKYKELSFNEYKRNIEVYYMLYNFYNEINYVITNDELLKFELKYIIKYYKALFDIYMLYDKLLKKSIKYDMNVFIKNIRIMQTNKMNTSVSYLVNLLKIIKNTDQNSYVYISNLEIIEELFSMSLALYSNINTFQLKFRHVKYGIKDISFKNYLDKCIKYGNILI